MKSYRFSLFLIISLLFVQTLSVTHAVTHPFHAVDLQAEAQIYSDPAAEIGHAGHSNELSALDSWVCELFDSVPNSALESSADLGWLIAEASEPGLVVAFVSIFSISYYPASWSRAPPTLN